MIIKRRDVRVCDGGLFADRPQSWVLGKELFTADTNKGANQ